MIPHEITSSRRKWFSVFHTNKVVKAVYLGSTASIRANVIPTYTSYNTRASSDKHSCIIIGFNTESILKVAEFSIS